MKINSIAIVMPVYNEQDNIRKVLKDWLRKIKLFNFKKIKFIIINDGSTDSTLENIKKVNSKYFKIINTKNKHHVLINALPCKYYAKDHIPNSFNLFNKDVAKMSVEDLHKWFKEVIKFNYPLIDQHIKTGKMQIYEVPIITYCAHDKCNASELTVKELMKKGFVNIHEYSGGMKEYRKNKKYM